MNHATPSTETPAGRLPVFAVTLRSTMRSCRPMRGVHDSSRSQLAPPFTQIAITTGQEETRHSKSEESIFGLTSVLTFSKTNIAGVLYIRGRRLTGWAIDRSQPHMQPYLRLQAADFQVDLNPNGFWSETLPPFATHRHIAFHHVLPTRIFQSKSLLTLTLKTGQNELLSFDVDGSYFSEPKLQIDSVTAHSITGWATDPAIQGSLEVIVTAGMDKQTIQANIFRKDLYDAGFGSGHHGFHISKPQLQRFSKYSKITVRAADLSHTINLVNSPKQEYVRHGAYRPNRSSTVVQQPGYIISI